MEAMKKPTSKEVRETFLDYFEKKGHRRVRSSSLVPENDPTLIFTNAGMNQFKEVFLGLEMRDYTRATSSQKCVRVSGKHNDLETVGRTARHHTFFEMLGNFSFGDYFKKEAIEFAWDLCTSVYAVPSDRLLLTVFEDDEEAYAIWRDRIGVAEDRIFRLGEKDNFWAMGETGPCGPCSELHYDLGTSPLGHEECGLECECGRYVEIWNLVFMQYNRDASGEMSPLPSPSIDTGMGLERIAAVLQGVASNYDTDLFRPLIEEGSRLTGREYGEDEEVGVGLRILADHSRAAAFLVADGVVPGNEGRGYVLRKILRRAIRHGRMLGREEPFLFTLVAQVAELMKDAYPELEATRDYAARIVRTEEEKFSNTLTHGMALLDEIAEQVRRKGERTLPGREIFRLYDTYGFPLDLAREIATERDLEIDETGFHEELQKQRERARASWKGGEKAVRKIFHQLAEEGFETEFVGYLHLKDVQGRVLAILRDEQRVDRLVEGETGEVLLDRSPFYAESGGQVADTGIIESEHAVVRVEDVFSPLTGLRLHRGRVLSGTLMVGESVHATVHTDRRWDTARNHTATHLLHAALREILGEHVKQAGSLVAPDRLRFDFSHFQALTHRELRALEELVNEKVRKNVLVRTEIQDLEEALRQGAMALFGEKYQDRVRVVRIDDFSTELCGGTHVSHTGEIALFKITGESSISAGVRRVEAVTGEAALRRFLETDEAMNRLSGQFRVKPERLVEAVERTRHQLKEAQRRLETLQLQLAQKDSGDPLLEARDVEGVRVLAKRVENLDRNALRTLADRLRNRLQSGVVVLGTPVNGKVSLVAMVTSDLTSRIRADRLIREIAQMVGGGGGGNAEMAEAGGRDASKLDEALEQTYQAVIRTLS